MDAHNVEKRVWVPQKLIVHGSIEQITHEQPVLPGKGHGSGDANNHNGWDVGFS